MTEFTLVMEDMRTKPPPPYKVNGGRVVDTPLRHRYIKLHKEVFSIEICYHGRPLDHRCGLCEYETKLLRGERR